LPGCLLSAGILVAPFVGLLYDVNLALGIAAVALVAAAFLAWDARSIAPAEMQPRLRTVTIVNAALAALVAVTLVARLLSDQAPGG
jgi:cell shape-determining protein MreD